MARVRLCRTSAVAGRGEVRGHRRAHAAEPEERDRPGLARRRPAGHEDAGGAVEPRTIRRGGKETVCGVTSGSSSIAMTVSAAILPSS